MIELPPLPAPNGVKPSFVRAGGVLRPALGGKVQIVNRLGDRFAFEVSYPPMPSARLGRIFVSRLIRGTSEGIRIEMPMLSFSPGAPGSPVVDGAGQAGSTLSVRGLTPHYAAREGQWFSHVHAEGRCLYNLGGQVIAGADGKADLPIAPMLRVEPEDGDAIELGKPMIEGFVIDDRWSWEMSLEHNLGIAFQIEEFQ